MSPWQRAWTGALGLPEAAPAIVVATLALACIFVVVILPSCALVSYLDRKLSADLQARVGPNRAGPSGILQPFADLLKLLQKKRSHGAVGRGGWLDVYTMALFSTVAILPLGSALVLVDTDVSAFVPFWITLLTAFVALLTGLSQGTVPGWLGGMRIAAQALAGAFPALAAILCAGIRAGGFRWSQVAAAQGAWPHQWLAFSSPFEFVAFLVFVVSSLVLLGVPPLDGGIRGADLHGGVAAPLRGERLSLLSFSRFYSFFLWSVIAVTLFLGGSCLPFNLSETLREAEAWRSLEALEVAVLLGKALALMIGVNLIATVSPRLRADQVTDMSWKVLSPLSLIALAGTAIWMGWRVLL